MWNATRRDLHSSPSAIVLVGVEIVKKKLVLSGFWSHRLGQNAVECDSSFGREIL